MDRHGDGFGDGRAAVAGAPEAPYGCSRLPARPSHFLGGNMSATRHLLIRRNPPELLSLVLPVYNEEEALPLLLSRLRALLATLPSEAEVVFVNDGSSDGTLHQLMAAAASDSRIRVLSLPRNFSPQIPATP